MASAGAAEELEGASALEKFDRASQSKWTKHAPNTTPAPALQPGPPPAYDTTCARGTRWRHPSDRIKLQFAGVKLALVVEGTDDDESPAVDTLRLEALREDASKVESEDTEMAITGEEKKEVVVEEGVDASRPAGKTVLYSFANFRWAALRMNRRNVTHERACVNPNKTTASACKISYSNPGANLPLVSSDLRTGELVLKIRCTQLGRGVELGLCLLRRSLPASEMGLARNSHAQRF
ncbi:hypothetical protein DFH08DRAFT_819823 [Mycena albidolilacea]|uniref:Uncharacterized protein n=1 Tax=Mycena albidolilacea TaxID=1033008 RepID=A0AAD6ZE08_9AGAR|nr:hypothetical protein DFH08DRAFT_819823 [Mycena albidolilacea]